MSKHTQGEWKSDKDHDDVYVEWEDGDGFTQTRSICCIDIQRDRDDEYEANKALITAAPKMYAMLDLIARRYRNNAGNARYVGDFVGATAFDSDAKKIDQLLSEAGG